MHDKNALFQLGTLLRQSGYAFTTVTPLSHARVLGRGDSEGDNYCEDEGRNLRDIFGWNKPFERAALSRDIFSLLEQCDAIEHATECAVGQTAKLRSRVRFSTVGEEIYVHSAYPTAQTDAVFFGPDTYRFVSLIEREVALIGTDIRRIADIGCGAGPGGISAALRCPDAELHLADINPLALTCAGINARLANVPKVQLIHSDLYASLSGNFDLIVANPPYLLDPDARTYRHGGGDLGFDLSKRIVIEGMARLAPGGTLILYSGAPVVKGRDMLRDALAPAIEARRLPYRYTELDPDVFGEELDNPGYENVDRIAAAALVVTALP